MALPRILADLIGTAQSYFMIGGGFRIKNSSGRADLRNAADSAWADAGMKTAKIFGTNASNSVTLQVPGSLGSNLTITLPPDAGSSGYVLTTDGAGTATWASVSASGIKQQRVTFDQTGPSGTLLASPPSGTILKRITIQVDSAAGGGSPNIQIGTSSTNGLYFDGSSYAANPLLSQYVYEVEINTLLTGTPASVIATITAASQTFSGSIELEYI